MAEYLDLKLYNEYLNGEKEAFELLYNKYKNKLRNFIFNIVNDYKKAEDITQEVFIYVLKNKFFQNMNLPLDKTRLMKLLLQMKELSI